MSALDPFPQRNISSTIPEPVYNFMDDYRWGNRLSLASVIREACRDWAVAHGMAEGTHGTVESQDRDAQ